jgi:hypothetical protein
MNKQKLSGIRAEALAEYNWRYEEIKFFENQIQRFPRTNAGMSDRDKFRKSLVSVLYSHFEGYCKFMFQLYINSINSENIKCKDASYPIAAATLDLEFKDLVNPKRKGRVLQRLLSIEDALHPFARRADFLEEMEDFMEKMVRIPDKAIDLESNLKAIVLKKNLYKLGLQHELFNSIEGEITQLLSMRNGIAHGNFMQGVDSARYKGVRVACIKIMTTLRSKIIESLKNKEYQKP